MAVRRHSHKFPSDFFFSKIAPTTRSQNELNKKSPKTCSENPKQIILDLKESKAILFSK
jgi:hypothetical protein